MTQHQHYRFHLVGVWICTIKIMLIDIIGVTKQTKKDIIIVTNNYTCGNEAIHNKIDWGSVNFM